MAKFQSITEAKEAGYAFELREKEHRFVVRKGDEVLGFTNFSARSDGSTDFDSTVLEPELRGTGLAAMLVELALGHERFKNQKIRASCWYVNAAIAKNPSLLAEGATFVD